MTFYPTDRLALFIDGANLYSAAKGLGFDIDYRKLLEEFRKRGVLVRAYYYTALVEDQDYSPIRPLVDWLDYNGYRLVTKPARDFTDAQGRKRWRGDMDVELAVDMMEMSAHADHMVLFSGDGDFRRLVEATQRRLLEEGGQGHARDDQDNEAPARGQKNQPPDQRTAAQTGQAGSRHPVASPSSGVRR
jgi:uncharacterized LabA/DUF88 family protein